MSKNNTIVNSSSSGIGFVGLLTVLFIALKLLGKISWSWGWVLAPIWISAIIIVGMLFIVLIIILIVALCKK